MFHLSKYRFVSMILIVALLLTMFFSATSVFAYCASGEAWPNRGWIKNVNTPETLYIWFYGTASANCNGDGRPLFSGQNSGTVYTDDTDGYWYSMSQQWVESHGLWRGAVVGRISLSGGRAISPNWCNRDTTMWTTLKIRCDY